MRIKKKRGQVGRPKKARGERHVHLAVSMRRADVARLRIAARREGVSSSAIVARLVTRWLVKQEE
jgi:hypothetical protein